MKIAYGHLLLCLFLSAACSQEQVPEPTERGIEVLFLTKQPTVTKGEDADQEKPSILIFSKPLPTGTFSFLRNEDAPEGWHQGDNGVFVKSLIFSSGTYRFLMANGLSSGEGDGRIAFKQGDATTGSYDKDYYLAQPVTENGELKTCRTDLFVDANAGGGFESNDEEYSLVSGNKFSVLRKITRLQARLDMLVRRAERVDGVGVVPIPEGEDNKDAMANALRKITGIEVVVKNVSSVCHVDGLRFSTPSQYRFSLVQAGSEFTFKPFNSKSFSEEFSTEVDADYARLEHSAYCSGPLLFPPSGKDQVLLDITIHYKAPLVIKKITDHPLVVNRNQVSLLTLWLMTEGIGMSVTIDSGNLDFSEQDGDDGFWN